MLTLLQGDSRVEDSSNTRPHSLPDLPPPEHTSDLEDSFWRPGIRR
jgi:hypothetical protein